MSPPPERGNDGHKEPKNLSVDRSKEKINNCIAKLVKCFYFVKRNKDEYEKAKEIFKKCKANLVNKQNRALKAILRS